MSAPLIEDDLRAKLDEEREAVQAERDRDERYEDFARALYPQGPGRCEERDAWGGTNASHSHPGVILSSHVRMAELRRDAAEEVRGTDPRTASPPLNASPAGRAGEAEGRDVGICDICDGALVIDPDELHAECPCGACRIPRKFFRHNEERPAGPLAAGRSVPKGEPSRWQPR